MTEGISSRTFLFFSLSSVHLPLRSFLFPAFQAYPASKAAPPPYFFNMSRPIFKLILLLGGLLPFRFRRWRGGGRQGASRERPRQWLRSEDRMGGNRQWNENPSSRLLHICLFFSLRRARDLCPLKSWPLLIHSEVASLAWPEICGCMRPDTSMAVISGLGHSLDFWLRDVEAVERPWPWMRARSTSDHGWELGARGPRSSSDRGCKWEEREQPYL